MKAPPVTYRDARPSDREWLFALHAATMQKYVAAVYGWEDSAQRRMFDEKFDPARIRIVEAGGRDVGMIMLEEKEDHLFLALIEVLPARQREGIGSSVIRDVLARAEQEERPVQLQVLRPNPARVLYERLGFEVLGETPTHYRMKKWPNKPLQPSRDLSRRVLPKALRNETLDSNSSPRTRRASSRRG